MTGTPLIEARNVSRRFRRSGLGPRHEVRALSNVSLSLPRGQSLGLVGESGSGKSTLVRLLLGLDRPSSGEIAMDGRPRTLQTKAERRRACARVQLVFQDPVSSFNPRRTLGESIDAPLAALTDLSRARRAERARRLFEWVELSPALLERHPHEVSGGQAQRAAIARALAPEPDLVVLDEALSSLDVSTQASILRLLSTLKQRLGIAYLMVAHDLAVVEVLCEEIAVMYAGRIVERGPARRVLDCPAHPYTEALIASVPSLEPQPGADVPLLPKAAAPVSAGCPFAPRCPYAKSECERREPALEEVAGARTCACLFPRVSSE